MIELSKYIGYRTAASARGLSEQFSSSFQPQPKTSQLCDTRRCPVVGSDFTGNSRFSGSLAYASQDLEGR